MTNALDMAGVAVLNGLARESRVLDQTVVLLHDSTLLKGGVLVAVLWWHWTRRGFFRADESVRIVRIVLGAFSCIAAARLLQLSLPFRDRPAQDPTLGLTTPYGFEGRFVDGWNALPSDQAALYFALATAIWAYDRRAGAAAFVWTLVVVCLPRVYSGEHYPSDLAAGGALGVALMAAMLRMPLPRAVRVGVPALLARRPAVGTAVLFVTAFQMAEMFRSLRDVVGWSLRLLVAAAEPNLAAAMP